MSGTVTDSASLMLAFFKGEEGKKEHKSERIAGFQSALIMGNNEAYYGAGVMVKILMCGQSR